MELTQMYTFSVVSSLNNLMGSSLDTDKLKVNLSIFKEIRVIERRRVSYSPMCSYARHVT